MAKMNIFATTYMQYRKVHITKLYNSLLLLRSTNKYAPHFYSFALDTMSNIIKFPFILHSAEICLCGLSEKLS